MLQQVSITDLDLTQLADVRRQLEEELNHLTNSFAQFKQTQAKFKVCIENVAEIKPSNKGKTILVPLTNSLYVPGKLSAPDHIIVDVGTDYFMQKMRAQAVKHYTAKVEYIRTNLETLQDTISNQQDNINSVISVMQAKLQQQQQQPAS
ncbi:Prefoldin [Mycena olivaceomarginata]|nr:Prefoldin [Mycena olivaceomarginata]